MASEISCGYEIADAMKYWLRKCKRQISRYDLSLQKLLFCKTYIVNLKNLRIGSFSVDTYPAGVYNKNTPLGYERMMLMSDKELCGCCGKTTERSEEERKKLINRLNRIEGQIRGIRGMVEKDAYCADILIQSAAVNAAVNSFNKELLASHIRGCVARDIRDGKDEVIDELVVTLQKLMK